MKKFFAILAVAGVMVACNDNASSTTTNTDSVNKAADVIAADAQKAADSAKKAINDTTNKMINKLDSAKDMLQKAGEKAKEGVEKAGEKAKEGIDKAADKVKEATKKN